MLLCQDRALLDAFRSGAPGALRTVYLHYAPRLLGFLRAGFPVSSGGQHFRFLGLRQAVELEDAAQEIFARAFAEPARRSYDGLRPFASYLFAIARNVMLNELRRHHDRFQPCAAPPEAAGLDAEPEVAVEEAEVRGLLDQFVQTLSVADRAYFGARFDGERNQADAARHLRMTRIRARRIEARIKRELLVFARARGYLANAPLELAGALAKVRS
jgi:RNA polymerase sigma factor (sigma-70 family)